MDIIRKILFIFLIALSMQNVTFAESQYVTAEGEYRLGDRDTRESAKQFALAEAKRRITERAGVFVQSYTEMHDFQITIDQAKMVSAAIIKIIEEKVDYYENGTICRAIVTAIIDEEKLHDILQQEQAFVQNLIFLNGNQPSYWIGGFCEDQKNWKWITGENFTYTNWNPGEPNHGADDENKIMMYRASVLGQWNDISANGNSDYTSYRLSSFGFVCEWDNVENSNSSTKNSKSIDGYEEFDGHYYKFFDETSNWDQAKKRCEKLGGHLVTITSKEEQALVQSMLFSKAMRSYYWAGGHRDKNGNWKWITGEPFIYTNWSYGEPNNKDNVENAMMLWRNVGSWNDIADNGSDNPSFGVENFGFICEWESAKNIKK